MRVAIRVIKIWVAARAINNPRGVRSALNNPSKIISAMRNGCLWIQGSNPALFDDGCRGTSFMRNHAPPGPYGRTMYKALRWSLGVGLFLMSEVPLCRSMQGALSNDGWL